MDPTIPQASLVGQRVSTESQALAIQSETAELSNLCFGMDDKIAWPDPDDEGLNNARSSCINQDILGSC